MGLKFDVGLSCVTVGEVMSVGDNVVGLMEELSPGSPAAKGVLWVTVELLGVPVEAVTAAEKSPVVVIVTKDTGIPLKFVAELFIPSFDTVVAFEDTVVPSVDVRDVLCGQRLLPLLLITFSLALAVSGTARLTAEGFMAVIKGRAKLCKAGSTVD